MFSRGPADQIPLLPYVLASLTAADDHDGWARGLVLGIVWVPKTGAGCQPVTRDSEVAVPKRGCSCACLTPSGNPSRDPSTFLSNSGPLYLFETSAMSLRGHMLAGWVLKVFLKKGSSKLRRNRYTSMQMPPKNLEKRALKGMNVPCCPSVK
jgi:hypothetical protein